MDHFAEALFAVFGVVSQARWPKGWDTQWLVEERGQDWAAGGDQVEEQRWTGAMGCSQGHLQRHLPMLVKVCLLCLLALCFCAWLSYNPLD